LATGQRELITGAPGINGAPAFSPDGKRMAVVLTKTGNPKIYALNLATKQLQQLTSGWSIDTEPAWSPDGQSILFTSNRDGDPQIYEYSFRDGRVKRLTFEGNYNARPRWLPSGQGFIMMHRDGRHGGFSLGLQRLGSTSIQILTRPGDIESPSLAPNGQMVVYAVNSGLAQVSIDSDVTLSMPSKDGVIQEPVWSPFLS
jgi:TolB protein